eukprot:gene16244-7623_t
MAFHHVYEMFVHSSIRGYHAYKETEVFVGEVMMCEPEEDNGYDECAVLVWKENGKMVGHVPIEFSKIFCNFLKDYGEMYCKQVKCRRWKGTGITCRLQTGWNLQLPDQS